MGQFRNLLISGLSAVLMIAGTVFAQPAGSPVAKHGHLRVEGSRIIGGLSGEEVQLRGVSSYAWGALPDAATVRWLADDWKISVFRAGVRTLNVNDAVLRTVINTSIEKGIYVVIDYHSHAAHTTANKTNAINFFRSMANTYRNSPNVIFEIYNEPCPADAGGGCAGDDWDTVVKPYSEELIAAIRGTGANNIIVVPTPAWSQRVDIATANPVAGDNLVYSMHFYASASQHEEMRMGHGPAALNSGHTIFASEFGIGHWNVFGPVDPVNANLWFDFLDENKVSWASWSLSRSREDNALIRNGSTASATAVPASGWRTGSDICNVNYRRAAEAYDSVRTWRREEQLTPVDPDRMVNSRYVSCTAHGDLSCTGHFIRHKLRKAYAEEMGVRVSFDLNGGTGIVPLAMPVIPGTTIGAHRVYKPHDGIAADGTGTGGINANTLIPQDEWIVLPSTEFYAKKGYRSDGNWYTNAAGTTRFAPGTTPVNADMTLYLKWEIDPNAIFSVTFMDGGSILKTENVRRGSGATAPEIEDTDSRIFSGWDVEFSEVTSDLTVTAQWTVKTYTVTFVNWDGVQIEMLENIEYGSSVTAPENPMREGYDFIGWDAEYDNVTSNLTITALFEKTPDVVKDFVFLLDNLEDGDRVNNFGYDWAVSGYGNFGAITNALSGDDFNPMIFAPTAGENRDGSSGYSAAMIYNMTAFPDFSAGITMSTALSGDDNTPVGDVLKNLNSISFWAKGTGNPVSFMLNTVQNSPAGIYASSPYNRYQVQFTPTSEWQQYTFNIGPVVRAAVEGASPANAGVSGQAGDFVQASGWGHAFTFKPEDLTSLIWEINSGAAAVRSGSLYVDDVQFTVSGEQINVTLPVTVTYKANEGGALRLGSVVTRNNISLKRQAGAAVPSIQAVADAGYEFVGWSDGVTNNPRADAASAMTVSAMFEQTSVTPEVYTFLLDDLEDGDRVNNLGYDWTISGYGNFGVITNALPGDNSNSMIFVPTAGENPDGSSGYSAAMIYNMTVFPDFSAGITMSTALSANDNTPAGDVLKNLNSISFWAKGTGNPVSFMLNTVQNSPTGIYASNPYNRYQVQFTPTSEWKQYTFNIGPVVPAAVEGASPANASVSGKAGDFVQASGWGHAFTFRPEDLTSILWEINSGAATVRSGSLYIDNVQFIVSGGPINVIPPVTVTHNFLLDDLEDGDRVNNFGYDWTISGYGSFGSITNALPGDNSNSMIFAPTAGENPDGSSGYSAAMIYTMPAFPDYSAGITMSTALSANDNTPAGDVLKNLNSISFWAKGTGNPVSFMLNTVQNSPTGIYASNPYNRYQVQFTPTSEWKQYTFNIGPVVPAAVEGASPANASVSGKAGDFVQASGWGHAFTFRPEDLTSILWEINSGAAAIRSGSLYVDDVQLIVSGEPINVTLPAVVTYQANEDDVPEILHAPEMKTAVLPANAGLTAAPNIVTMSAGAITFLHEGEQIVSAQLTVYDASGKVVNKVTINDRAKNNTSKREVGKWHLKDARGRTVNKGTYLVRGVIKTSDGKSERVSLMIGVR